MTCNEFSKCRLVGYAAAGDFEKAVEIQKKALSSKGLSEEDKRDLDRELNLYLNKKPFEKE